MILSNKTGIITGFTETKTKTGKPMIVLTHTIGNSDTLQKVFVFEDDENYQDLRMHGKNLIGAKLESKTEIPEA